MRRDHVHTCTPGGPIRTNPLAVFTITVKKRGTESRKFNLQLDKKSEVRVLALRRGPPRLAQVSVVHVDTHGGGCCEGSGLMRQLSLKLWCIRRHTENRTHATSQERCRNAISTLTIRCSYRANARRRSPPKLHSTAVWVVDRRFTTSYQFRRNASRAGRRRPGGGGRSRRQRDDCSLAPQPPRFLVPAAGELLNPMRPTHTRTSPCANTQQPR